MKNLEQMAGPIEDPNVLSDEEELDVNVLTAMGQKLMQEGGGQALDKALASTKDPVKVVGTFISQFAMGLMQHVPQELNVSPRAYLAQGGFVDRMLDEISSQYKLPEQVTNEAFNMAIETMKAAVQAGQAGEAQQQGGPPGSPQPSMEYGMEPQ